MVNLIEVYRARLNDRQTRLNDVQSRMMLVRKNVDRYIGLSREKAVLQAQVNAYKQILNELHPRMRAVGHAFGSDAIHDDFTVVGDSVQFNVFLPAGGTQLVRLSRDDLKGMTDALHAM